MAAATTTAALLLPPTHLHAPCGSSRTSGGPSAHPPRHLTIALPPPPYFPPRTPNAPLAPATARIPCPGPRGRRLAAPAGRARRRGAPDVGCHLHAGPAAFCQAREPASERAGRVWVALARGRAGGEGPPRTEERTEARSSSRHCCSGGNTPAKDLCLPVIHHHPHSCQLHVPQCIVPCPLGEPHTTRCVTHPFQSQLRTVFKPPGAWDLLVCCWPTPELPTHTPHTLHQRFHHHTTPSPFPPGAWTWWWRCCTRTPGPPPRTWPRAALQPLRVAATLMPSRWLRARPPVQWPSSWWGWAWCALCTPCCSRPCRRCCPRCERARVCVCAFSGCARTCLCLRPWVLGLSLSRAHATPTDTHKHTP